MVHDAAAGAHAAAGQDDAALLHVERARLLTRAHELEDIGRERVVAVLEHLAQRRLQQFGIFAVDFGGLDAHRRIEIGGRQVQLRIFFLELVQFVEHSLGPVDHEGGDQDLGARRERVFHGLLELRAGVLERFVEPVAVGGFDEHEIRLVDHRGRQLDDAAELSEVAGEDDLDRLLPLVLGDPGLHDGAAENVAGRLQAHLEPRQQLRLLLVGQGREQLQSFVHVLFAVQGLHHSRALAHVLARLPLRVLLHDARGIVEQYIDKLCRGLRAVYLAAEALLDEQRELTGMVNVGVGQDHGRDVRRVVGEAVRLMLLLVLTLSGAAINQHLVISGVDHVVGTGYLAGRAEKPQLHTIRPRGLPPFDDRLLPV